MEARPLTVERDDRLTLTSGAVWDARRPGAPPCIVVGVALCDVTSQDLVVYRVAGVLHVCALARFDLCYVPRPEGGFS